MFLSANPQTDFWYEILPYFAVERNAKSEIGFVTLVTLRKRVQYAWQPLKKWRVFYRLTNKRLWGRALRRRGFGINCECGGVVRNYTFSGYPSVQVPLLFSFTRSLLVRGVISANILFQILLWRTCMQKTFHQILRFDHNFSLKWIVHHEISVPLPLQKKWMFLYNNTFLIYS